MKVVCRDLDDITVLHKEGIIDSGSSQGHEYLTTLSVINAYGDPLHLAHQLINSNLICLMRFNEDDVCEVSKIFTKHRTNLSFTDCSVIYCAIVTNGVLISNETIIINVCMAFSVKTFTVGQYCEQVKLCKTG